MEQTTLKLQALLIDDSASMRTVIKESLYETELAEFSFTEVDDAAEAMSIFDPEKFDIIFLDWNMPRLNGLEFARHVRSMRSAKHIPIVMITAENTESKQTKAYTDARITCFITKPFTVKDIYGKLSSIIDTISKHLEEVKINLNLNKKSDSTYLTKKVGNSFFSRLLGF